jgi:hypothetical protein
VHARSRCPARLRRLCRARPAIAAAGAPFPGPAHLLASPWPTIAFFICSAVYSATLNRPPATPPVPRPRAWPAAACSAG